jgi:hypothetical protein
MGESSFKKKLAKLVEFLHYKHKILQFVFALQKSLIIGSFMKKCNSWNLKKTLQVLHISGCGVDLKMQEKTI